jgi:hypothetical protein
MQCQKKNHGTASSKSILSSERKTDLLIIRTDGQRQAIQVNKDHITAQLEETSILEELLLMHITNVAFMLV